MKNVLLKIKIYIKGYSEGYKRIRRIQKCTDKYYDLLEHMKKVFAAEENDKYKLKMLDLESGVIDIIEAKLDEVENFINDLNKRVNNEV